MLQAARQGSIAAQEELDNVPECPEEIEYLVHWTYMLLGRSGFGMSAVVPLSHREIEAWARLRRLNLDQFEIDALIELDAAIRDPEIGVEKEEVAPKVIQTRSWPTRKE